MLISNLEILNAVLSGTDESNPTKVYYSGSDTYDALGRGERIVLQLVVDSASLPANGVKKVIVNMERSNDGKVWEAVPEAKTDVTLTPASTLPTSKFLDTGNVLDTAGAIVAYRHLALGAKVRFVAHSGMDATAVRLIATVRGEAGR
ncbi:MAG: hypothetical protein U0326_27445 [Polyangiales bacterium]